MTIDHAWMEYSALGYSGTNSGGAHRHRELRSSTTTRTASTPTPRSTATRRPRRTAPARTTGSARSPTPTRAGCSCTTTCTTTTTRTCPRPATPPHGPDRHRHDRVRRSQRHGHGQHVLQQRGVGHPVRPVPRQRHARRWTRRARAPAASRCRASAASTTRWTTRCCTTPSATTGSSGTRRNADYGQIVLNAGKPQNCYAGNTAPERQRARRPRADPAHLRDAHHGGQHRWTAAGPGAVRHRLRERARPAPTTRRAPAW